MRGRDIKRNGYEFADLYLICTFPSKKYNIDKFPAVKEFLEGFRPKLKQTGERITKIEQDQIIDHAEKNGIILARKSLETSRKKTTNQRFETQDSIGYWDDFNKQKIIYPNMTSDIGFVLDNDGYLTNQKCFIMTGKDIEYICDQLNKDYMRLYYTWVLAKLGASGYELSKIFMENIPILPKGYSIDFNEDEINFISSVVNSKDL